MADEANKIQFVGNLPSIQSAILLDGDGDGARIRIDISRKYIYEVIKLQSFAGKNFKVTIELEENNEPTRY